MEYDKFETPEAKEALIDGLSYICQKLFEFFDGRKTNLMPVSQLLVTLALPSNKNYHEVTNEDVFRAVDKVLGILDTMEKRRDANIH